MSNKILICDDEIELASIIKSILEKEGHDIEMAHNGEDAIYQIYEKDYDLILLDVQMPGLTGFEVCEVVKNNEKTKDIPVIFLTGLRDFDSCLQGLRLGANDFITKPVATPELILRVRNMLKIREYSKFLKKYNVTLKDEIDKKTFEIRKMNGHLIMANDKIKDAYIDTVYRLSMVAEFKDSDTAEHLLRISSLSSFVASKLGMSQDEIERIYFAAPMHDIGKIGISNEILLKKSRLSEKEFEIIQNHTQIGGNLLGGSKSEILKHATSIARSHHEKFDGTGYPGHLKGTDIPLEGRIVMLVDVYDALRSVRPYKSSKNHEEVLHIFSHGDNRIIPENFDPELLEIFMQNNHDIDNLFNRINKDKISFRSIFLKKEFLKN